MARKAAAKQSVSESAEEKQEEKRADSGQAPARAGRAARKPAGANAGTGAKDVASAPDASGGSSTSSGMRIGYARVSTLEQNPALQRDALKAAGCDKVFEDRASGAKAERPGLAQALEYARPGDTLVVWRLDRLGRSLKDLIDRVQELESRGIGFKSLREGFDTTTGSGRLVFHVFGALAEFERALIRERTGAGLAAARARGRKGGRKKALTPAQVGQMRVLARDPNITVGQICTTFGVSRNTFYRHVHERPEDAHEGREGPQETDER
jgi:DNA invertase Pin-like site-specific DNA recombinase